MKSAIEKIVNRPICGSLRVSIPDTSFSPYVLTIETLEKGVKNFQS